MAEENPLKPPLLQQGKLHRYLIDPHTAEIR